MTKSIQYQFSSIQWDTDGEDPAKLNLPLETTITAPYPEFDPTEEGADLLSDKFGFCVFSFEFRKVPSLQELISDAILDYNHPWPGEDAGTKEHREKMLTGFRHQLENLKLNRLGSRKDLRKRVISFENLNGRTPDIGCLPGNQHILEPTVEEQAIIDLYAAELRRLDPGTPAETQ
jgi:hypothetical protein